MLVADLLEKKERSQGLQRQREQGVQQAEMKNQVLREMVSEVARKTDFSARPILYEDRYAEWKIEDRRNRKNKKADDK